MEVLRELKQQEVYEWLRSYTHKGFPFKKLRVKVKPLNSKIVYPNKMNDTLGAKQGLFGEGDGGLWYRWSLTDPGRWGRPFAAEGT